MSTNNINLTSILTGVGKAKAPKQDCHQLQQEGPAESIFDSGVKNSDMHSSKRASPPMCSTIFSHLTLSPADYCLDEDKQGSSRGQESPKGPRNTLVQAELSLSRCQLNSGQSILDGDMLLSNDSSIRQSGPDRSRSHDAAITTRQAPLKVLDLSPHDKPIHDSPSASAFEETSQRPSTSSEVTQSHSPTSSSLISQSNQQQQHKVQPQPANEAVGQPWKPLDTQSVYSEMIRHLGDHHRSRRQRPLSALDLHLCCNISETPAIDAHQQISEEVDSDMMVAQSSEDQSRSPPLGLDPVAQHGWPAAAVPPVPPRPQCDPPLHLPEGGHRQIPQSVPSDNCQSLYDNINKAWQLPRLSTESHRPIAPPVATLSSPEESPRLMHPQWGLRSAGESQDNLTYDDVFADLWIGQSGPAAAFDPLLDKATSPDTYNHAPLPSNQDAVNSTSSPLGHAQPSNWDAIDEMLFIWHKNGN